MAENEKFLSERMADLEDKIDYIIYSGKPKYEPELSEATFNNFYTRFENQVKEMGALAGRITMNTRFENILKHKVLYPDHEIGYWFPIGKASYNIPVDFMEMKNDYVVEILDAGNFPSTEKSIRGLR